MHRKVLGGLFAALLLLPVPGAGQAARTPGAPTRVPVTVVLVERLPVPGAPFVVQRRPTAAQRDVILLPADADASVLSEAVQTLLVARQAGGDIPAEAATMRVRPQRGRTTPRPCSPGHTECSPTSGARKRAWWKASERYKLWKSGFRVRRREAPGANAQKIGDGRLDSASVDVG